MRRRTFLGLSAALAAAGAAGWRARPASAATDRLTWWDPAATTLVPGQFVALEWRYLAARITAGGEDFGFIVSMADYNPIPPPLNISGRNELLVMRQDLAGDGGHATSTYPGTLSYDAQTATYSFAGNNPAVTATWRLDTAAQRYTLSVASPELTLSDLLITPAGDLIPEGGTGVVSSGTFSYNGTSVQVDSDYFADWATVSSGGAVVGVGRLDMQTLRPNFGSGGSGGFSHHWFALAATLADDTPAWVSGWQILAGSQVAWGVTVARGQGASWSVSSIGSDAGFSGAQPLAVTILDYQAVPGADPAARTGSRWRFQAGQAAANDVIDLDLAVPPGQFIKGARVGATGIQMQESVGASARGLVGGKAVRAARLAIVESTFSEPGEPPPAQQKVHLPLIRR